MTYRTSHNSLKFLNYIKFKNRSGTFLTPCNGNKTTVQKIEQVNKFIRMIFGLHQRASVTNIMQDNGIITIDEINKLELCSFMYKN